MSILAETVEHAYCDHCNLATPTWRKRCIHCVGPLYLRSKKKRIAPNSYSRGSMYGYEALLISDRFPNAI